MAIISGTPIEGSEVEIEVMSVSYTTDTPLDSSWIQVDNVPYPHEYPTPGFGQRTSLIYNTETGEFRFEIVSRELSREEEKDKALVDALDILIEEGIL